MLLTVLDALPEARPPKIVALSVSSPLVKVVKVLTLPPISKVQSPAGMIIPALAAEAESAKTAPATANLIFLFIYFSYCF